MPANRTGPKPSAYLPTDEGSTLDIELRLGLHPVASELYGLVLPVVLRQLGKMSRHQLRAKADFVAHELTTAMVDGEGIPQDRARFLAFQAVKAAQRADFRAALLAPRKRGEAMPESPFRSGYQEALELLYEAAQELPSFNDDLRMEISTSVDPVSGRNFKAFMDGVQAAYNDAQKEFEEASR